MCLKFFANGPNLKKFAKVKEAVRYLLSFSFFFCRTSVAVRLEQGFSGSCIATEEFFERAGVKRDTLVGKLAPNSILNLNLFKTHRLDLDIFVSTDQNRPNEK